jgi:hypothetical protein
MHECFAARLDDQIGSALCFVKRVPDVHDHVRALAAKGDSNSAADVACGTGHYRNVPVQWQRR